MYDRGESGGHFDILPQAFAFERTCCFFAENELSALSPLSVPSASGVLGGKPAAGAVLIK
jgi:hypothetical protein